jgi:hypothetical protein
VGKAGGESEEEQRAEEREFHGTLGFGSANTVYQAVLRSSKKIMVREACATKSGVLRKTSPTPAQSRSEIRGNRSEDLCSGS